VNREDLPSWFDSMAENKHVSELSPGSYPFPSTKRDPR
jgi:hypothetical protein